MKYHNDHGVSNAGGVLTITVKVPKGDSTITFNGCAFADDATLITAPENVTPASANLKTASDNSPLDFTYSGDAADLTFTIDGGAIYLHQLKVVSTEAVDPTEPTGSPKPTQGPVDYAADFTNQSSTHSILTADEVSGKTSVSFGLNAAGERVSVDSEDAVWTFDSFKYHSEEHGLNPGSIVVSVPGPVKITYGTCAWGGDVTVKDSSGNTVATLNTKTGACYHNNKTVNIVETYYKGEAATLTMTGGSYVPYVAVKTVDVSEIPNDATITFANGNDTFEGTLPDEITEDIGTEVTVPLNRTMYIEGKTLTAWTDGTNSYTPGDKLTLNEDITLTPVFTENTKTLSGTVTFDFQRKNGAPTLAWQNVNAIYVSQATVDGTSIDVKMDVDTNNGGKVANANWTDWAQFGVGTKFTVPVAAGSVVTMGETYQSGGQYTINSVEKTGDNQSETAVEAGTMEVVITGGNYYRTISVTY